MDATKVFDDLTWDDVVIAWCTQSHPRVLSQGSEAQGSPCSVQPAQYLGGEEHLEGVNA